MSTVRDSRSTPAAPSAATHGARADQLQWLRAQSTEWQAEGLVTVDQAEAILARYTASRGFSLGRLLLALGACFVGVGLVWLVAANLEHLSPLLRFVAVCLIWLVVLVGSEALHERGKPPVVVAAGRTIAAFAVGAVVFQAAQSLQVPSYAPHLLGAWGAAALLHAYVVRARGPLLVGAVAITGYALWDGLEQTETFGDAVLLVGLLGVLGVALGSVHRGAHVHFNSWWRALGIPLSLVALFVACIPVDEGLTLSWQTEHVVVAVLALVAAGVALALGDRLSRIEVLVAALALGTSLLMAAWPSHEAWNLEAEDWLHTLVAVVLYVGLAVGVAVAGTLRDSREMVVEATLALVVFTTFQSFAVFSALFDGAWLFLLLGLVFLGTGVTLDRARRRLAAELADELGLDQPTGTTTTEGDER